MPSQEITIEGRTTTQGTGIVAAPAAGVETALAVPDTAVPAPLYSTVPVVPGAGMQSAGSQDGQPDVMAPDEIVSVQEQEAQVWPSSHSGPHNTIEAASPPARVH